MVVIVLERCPPALRGDLTRWLQEISLGVYVGNVTARVRDRLWRRVCEETRGGRATMAFTAVGEQKFDFRVHGTAWEPIDFDGLKLMMRPSEKRLKELREQGAARKGNSLSNAHRRMISRKVSKARAAGNGIPDEYAVIDIETTGLNSHKDEIIEVAALKVAGEKIVGQFETLVRSTRPIPKEVTELTGITNEMLLKDGVELTNALPALLEFVGGLTMIAYNAPFDLAFLQEACRQCGAKELENRMIDLLYLARRELFSAGSFRLEDVADSLEIAVDVSHRAMADCLTAHKVFEKLIEK